MLPGCRIALRRAGVLPIASLAVALVTLTYAGEALPPATKIDFNFQIRPLLSDRCFTCHGPDERARKARLNMHTREGALRGGKSGNPTLKPGDPAGSPLLQRVTASDPDELMPPPESRLPPLTKVEVELLRQWIEQGADYAEHWAFLPLPERVRVPSVAEPVSDMRNEIDAFVSARLRVDGLALQPPAPREALARRVSLDLTGLPPTLAELDAFLTDIAPGAYERFVDRLLDSPHYGERMATEWLDLARYADTYGYQADVDRDLSPWRDWVIAAFNRNLGYDEFLTWQIAGDLLPNPSREQVLATAFNRLHRQTNEGGSVESEFQAEYVADRVNTFGTAMLGLTVECARCHDHKYDPITQRDYYRLEAYFNSIDESGLYSHFTRATPSPTLLMWAEEARQRHADLLNDIVDADRRVRETEAGAAERFTAWQTDQKEWPLPQPVVSLAFDVIADGRSPDAASTNGAELVEGPVLAEGHSAGAIKFDGDNFAVVKGAAAFGRTDPFSFSLWLNPAERQPRAVVFHRSRSWTDSGSRGYEMVLEGGRPFFGLIHFWPGNAMGIRAREALPPNAWSHLAVTYDGTSRAAGLKLYLNGRLMSADVVRDNLFKDIIHRAEWGDGDVGNVHLTLAGRFRDSGFKHGRIDEFRAYDVELIPHEVQALTAGRTSLAAPALAWYLARVDGPHRMALAESRELRQRENSLINDVPEMMVMKELPEPRATFVLRRGAYDQPGDPVEAGLPERIFAPPAGLPKNRLGLAKWMTDPRHPLTARVAVNQVWRLHFGRGLVATVQDFGSQGRLPTHPELLDWLARDFIDSGWNRKALHKRIVLSATYRQTSAAPAALFQRDPENLLLARGPKHRLSAEQIRDAALVAGGLLVPTVGGPSVKPYQPAGLWEEAGTGKTYVPDHGEKLYRRSLYTFWRRTAPPPALVTFDAPTREICTARREVTSTPLQALVLLNDPQFVEAARALAERTLLVQPAGASDLGARLASVFRVLTAREPQPRERDTLTRLYSEQLAGFQTDLVAAEKYLSTGERPRAASLPVAELAALTVVANAVMNHDEFVMKR